MKRKNVIKYISQQDEFYNQVDLTCINNVQLNLIKANVDLAQKIRLFDKDGDVNNDTPLPARL